jgi:hypothetical protein
MEIDNLTLLLLAAAVSLLLYDRFARPTSLVHPLLLGKQAEVSRVRKEGESGIYRSFATGHGTPVRDSVTLGCLAKANNLADNSPCKRAEERTECRGGYERE